jgi:hypothetical protein
VTLLEEIGFGHRQTSEEDSGSGWSTIIDTKHLFFATEPSYVVNSASNVSNEAIRGHAPMIKNRNG